MVQFFAHSILASPWGSFSAWTMHSSHYMYNTSTLPSAQQHVRHLHGPPWWPWWSRSCFCNGGDGWCEQSSWHRNTMPSTTADKWGHRGRGHAGATVPCSRHSRWQFCGACATGRLESVDWLACDSGTCHAETID